MNSKCRRNIYTLGEFHSSKQSAVAKLRDRKYSDPFEKDPFKIQSYNFRYADRPIFPVKPMPQKYTKEVTKTFDTYYYNNKDFPRSVNNSRDFKQEKVTSRFHQYRKRKFLQNASTQSLNRFCSSNHTDVSTLTNYSRTSDNPQERLQRKYSTTSNRNFSSLSPRSIISSSLLKRSNINDGLENARYHSRESVPSTVKDYLRVEPSTSKVSNRSSLNSTSNLKRSFTENNLEFKKSSYLIPNNYKANYEKNGYTSPNQERSKTTMEIIENNFTKDYPKNGPSTSSLINNNFNSFKQQPQSHHSFESIRRKRIKNSGCEININIKSLNDDSQSKNLTIQIQEKPSLDNLANDHINNLSRESYITSNITSNIKLNINSSSSKSLVIDKKISNITKERSQDLRKYSNNGISHNTQELALMLNDSPIKERRKRLPSMVSLASNLERKPTSLCIQQQEKIQNSRDKQKERLGVLNSIYSPSQPIQTNYKRRASISKERMPSLLAWHGGNSTNTKSKGDSLSHNKTSRIPERNLSYTIINSKESAIPLSPGFNEVCTSLTSKF
ncbi:uncharacterized protein LOC142241023 isoform X2 [Haematobia irritans]|uniref:uncharacterized protein LOC142241023 isoform X2 n=1 Tax=Haematobia irritans TaxID=7368 RepID=UPI003F505BEB